MSDTVGAEVAREAEQFLFHEAWLLDERRFEDWLHLFTDDATYRMPTRRAVAKSQAGARIDVEEEIAGPNEVSWFDETKETLFARVLRLRGGVAWAEDPPSRTRRLVTNVHVSPGEGDGELRVRSYFLLHRTRHQTERETFVGCRRDVLRRTAEGLQIARREILLDETVLTSPNLSVFF